MSKQHLDDFVAALLANVVVFVLWRGYQAMRGCIAFVWHLVSIGPLHDPVTGYKITHAGEQLAQWDFQNNEIRTSPPGRAFVLEVQLRNLLTSMCDFVRCHRVVQRTN